MSTITIPGSHGDIWKNRNCLYDLATDEALLVCFLLLSQVPLCDQGGGEDEYPLYSATFNETQAYQFVRMHMERVAARHREPTTDHYIYSRKEDFDEALASLCIGMGWSLDRETRSLLSKPENGAEAMTPKGV